MVDFASQDVAKIVERLSGRIASRYGLDHEEVRQDIYVEILGGTPYDSARSRVSTFIHSRSRAIPQRAIRPKSVKASTGLTIGEPWNQSERAELGRNDSHLGDYLTGDRVHDGIVKGLAEGKSKKEIARYLGIRVRTVLATIAKLRGSLENV